MEYDIKYMKRALQIAANGLGNTSPNPMVGAVIVNCDGRIIGEGFHRRCGEGHAEVNAISSAKDREQLKDSTIYVTLEPCSHYGKTPPCAKLIIDNRIPRAVIGCLDPFIHVRGKGVKMLQDAGIDVVTGVLEDECRRLNAVFMTAHTLRRPFVTLKWAQSRDGFMDHKRDMHNTPARFSTPLTTALVHRLRSLHDAIMAGNNTVIADNPHLNVRHWHGRNPIKAVIDRNGKLPATAHLFNKPDEPVLRLSLSERDDLPPHVTTIECCNNIDKILEALYCHGITSLLVEGGATLLQAFIDSGNWDYARIEVSDRYLGNSGTVPAPIPDKHPHSTENIDGNTIINYSNSHFIQVKSI